MKRTDLIALAERLKPMAAAPCFDGLDMAAIDAFLRQIAQAQPVAWRVECRWADGSSDWRKYADYGTEKSARSSQQRFANPGDIESRIVPLYTLPLED